LEEKQNPEEKRRHKRHSIIPKTEYTINFKASNEKEFNNAVSINISYGGVMFATDKPYECNSEIDTKISFSKDNEPAIILQGIVSWADQNPDTAKDNGAYCIGIQFNKMTESQETSLKAFIDNYIVNY
jgi:Tfp pilus assembly protein PilZ